MEVRCKLISLYAEPQFVVKLKHKVPVILGRIPDLRIRDAKCSRSQLLVTADLNAKLVSVERIGKSKSAINGKLLRKGKITLAHHRDKIEVIPKLFVFLVKFKKHSKRSSDHDLMDELMTTETEQTSLRNNASTLYLKKSVSFEMGGWEHVDGGNLLIFTPKDVTSSSKIAGYDLDGTLIQTKSGKTFAKDKNDWEIMNKAHTLNKLKEIHENQYKLVIFTNQAGIGNSHTKSADFKEKIEHILRAINVPIQVFIATTTDIYRKPAYGMWNYLVNKKNGGMPVNVKRSFFCGDAAGRLPTNRKKKDFACTDRLFALNLGLQFFTPEEHFLNHKPAAFELLEFNPKLLLNSTSLTDPPNATIANKSKNEVILMIGPPASGKSYFAKKKLVVEGYVYVSRDELGNWKKCVKMLEKALSRNKSAVIDNTNPCKESRLRYIEVAKKYGIDARAFVMNVSIDHALHNNKFRDFTDRSQHVSVKAGVIQNFFSKYEEPSLNEGFSEIVKINFIPQFTDDEYRRLYFSYLL